MAAYQKVMPSDSPFWEALARLSFEAADKASADAALQSIDRESFIRVSARKIAGAKIPLAAVSFSSWSAGSS